MSHVSFGNYIHDNYLPTGNDVHIEKDPMRLRRAQCADLLSVGGTSFPLASPAPQRAWVRGYIVAWPTTIIAIYVTTREHFDPIISLWVRVDLLLLIEMQSCCIAHDQLCKTHLDLVFRPEPWGIQLNLPINFMTGRKEWE